MSYPYFTIFPTIFPRAVKLSRYPRGAFAAASFLLLLFSLTLFWGCSLKLPPHENAKLNRAMRALSFRYDPEGTVLNATADPVVVIPYQELRVEKIDGIDLEKDLISGKRVYFVAPGYREIEISYPSIAGSWVLGQSRAGVIWEDRTVGINWKDKNEGMRWEERAARPRKEISFTFQKGKHYRLGGPGEDFIFKEIEDSATLYLIEGYLKVYREAYTEWEAKAREVEEIWNSYESYEKAHPSRLEGKWTSDAFLKNGTLEFSGNRIKLVEYPGTFLERIFEGTFRYDENTIVPLYSASNISGFAFVLEDGARPKAGSFNPDLVPLYYYELDGDILVIKQNITFINNGMNQAGTYLRVR
jgi:hypothetical protein